jgi:hypothetical protein
MGLAYGVTELSREKTAKVIEIGKEVGLVWYFKIYNDTLRPMEKEQQEELIGRVNEYAKEITEHAKESLEQAMPEDVTLVDVEIKCDVKYGVAEYDINRTGKEIVQMSFATARAVIPGMEPSIAVAHLSWIKEGYRLRGFSFDDDELRGFDFDDDDLEKEAYKNNLPQLQEYAEKFVTAVSNRIR